MISVCLPSDALSQHLPSYLGFSYLGHRVSLQDCSSKAQPVLLTLDERYLHVQAAVAAWPQEGQEELLQFKVRRRDLLKSSGCTLLEQP